MTSARRDRLGDALSLATSESYSAALHGRRRPSVVDGLSGNWWGSSLERMRPPSAQRRTRCLTVDDRTAARTGVRVSPVRIVGSKTVRSGPQTGHLTSNVEQM